MSCLVWLSPMASVQAADVLHRYHFKDKVELTVASNPIAVVGNPGGSDSDLVTAVQGAGLDVLQITPMPVQNWSLITLAQPDLQGVDVKARLDAVAASRAVQFASPVFQGEWGRPVIPTRDILVAFQPQVSEAQALRELANHRAGQVVARDFASIPGLYRVRHASANGLDVLATANALAQLPHVRYAEPDWILPARRSLIPNDPGFPNCWGLHNTGQDGGVIDKDMDAPEAWDITTGDPSVIVVILDDGVQLDHPDLAANVFAGADFTSQSGNGGPISECDNHGTAVAGCVSAVINNSLGTVGIAPECRIASARTCIENVPCDGFGTCQVTWIVESLAWGQDIGARVTNFSWLLGFTSPAIADQYARTREAGLIHFAPTGNDSSSTIEYPASLPTVNAVAAMNRFGDLASFSNHGSGLAFTAPGEEIYTIDRTGRDGWVPGDYVFADGTSFASPYAAGVAALLLSIDDSLTPGELEAAIQIGAEDLGPTGYDTTFGWGLVNASEALQSLEEPDDVIEICSAAQLQAIGTIPSLPNDGHYVLTCDLDLHAANWDPIGDGSSNFFDGVFDGQGHRIIDLDIERPDEQHVGFFAIIDDDAIIKNLILECNDIHGHGSGSSGGGVGCLAAENYGTIINCHVRVVKGHTAVDIEASPGGHMGGLVGGNYGGRIIGCTVRDVSIEPGGKPDADEEGGIAGTNARLGNDPGLILWCYVEGDIDGEDGPASSNDIGGIAGTNEDGLIIQSMAIVDRVRGSAKVGGIAGDHWGGLSLVADCAFGTYPDLPNEVDADNGGGGIAGEIDRGARIERCYVAAIIDVDGSQQGGVAGDCGSGTIEQSYYNAVYDGPCVGSGCATSTCEAKTTRELRTEGTFLGWDFEQVWWIDEGIGYPQLCGLGTMLDPPANPTASSDIARAIEIQWGPVTYEGGCGPFYQVYRADSPGGERVPISPWQTQTSFLDEGVKPQVTYYYWVKAAATFYVHTTGEEFGARESEFSDIAIGTPAPPCFGDIAPPGGDGRVGVDDLVLVITEWNETDSVADVNGDGIVDVDDLVDVIGAWGLCP